MYKTVTDRFNDMCELKCAHCNCLSESTPCASRPCVSNSSIFHKSCKADIVQAFLDGRINNRCFCFSVFTFDRIELKSIFLL